MSSIEEPRAKIVPNYWLERFLQKEGYVTLMNRTYAPIAIATSLAEAVFIHYLLYLWMAKRDDDDRYIYRKSENLGVWIRPPWFCRNTGLSIRQFRDIVKRYDILKIIKTTVVQGEGNCKYYKLNRKKLKRYLRERLSKVPNKRIERVWEEDIDFDEISGDLD